MRIGPEVLRDPEKAASLEWLLPDGLGGWAASSVLGLNTRREHGLLVVARRPPGERLALLSRLEEAVLCGERRYELGTNAYPGTLQPRGFEYAAGFVLDPLPTLTWELPEGRLARTLARVHGQPGLAVDYSWEGAPARLELRPLLSYREPGVLQRENTAVSGRAERSGEDVVLHPYPGCPAVVLRLPGGDWQGDGLWYRSFLYARDHERGQDAAEDLWSPGVFTVRLEPERAVTLLAWADAIPPATPAGALVPAERLRLRELAGGATGLLGWLRRAADAFLLRAGESGLALLSGYPDLDPTARAAGVALPGLCLATGRHAEARSLLASGMTGLVPAGSAARWQEAEDVLRLAVAAQRFLEATHDHAFLREHLLGPLTGFLDACREGRAEGLALTPDGLLALHGSASVALQALWYNGLLFAAELARASGGERRAAGWVGLATQARAGVLRLFWSAERGWLADAVEADGRLVPSLRAGQLLAIGLPHALVPREPAARILEAATRELLTPAGLRSGDGLARPDLAGVYFDALIRIHGEEGKRAAREWLEGFAPLLERGTLGWVPEAFDADAPHCPRGLIAHAAGTAELLRLATRLASRPPARPPRSG